MAKTASKSSRTSGRSNSRSGSSTSKSGSQSKSKSSPTSRSGSQSKSRSSSSPTSRGGGRSQKSGMPGSMLEKFFLDELKDVYSAEKQGLKGLAKMAKNSTTPELKEAFENHRMQSEGQIQRLEQVFEILGARPQAKKCEAMEGLMKEVDSVLEDTEDDTLTRDVALIMGAQKAEHYEIASYGGLAQLARTMGQNEIADLLTETLEEEKETDELLTQVAENNINVEASQEDEEGEEGEEEE
jgi:ferritin-like metal-binding protein YciE